MNYELSMASKTSKTKCDPASVPILLIIWRRADTLHHVINALRPLKPRKIFVACDGANPDRQGETEKVAATRSVIDQEINWQCQVERFYSATNQGCRHGVVNAINWFFHHVEEGIILEDDCLPHPDFVGFCAELLELYRHDQRIWCIGGSNFQNERWRGKASYYFSHYPHTWGWASWRRCWAHYDHNLNLWPEFLKAGMMDSIFTNELEKLYWERVWSMMHNNEHYDAWDYQWIFTCMSNHGLSVIPNVNLIGNIGTGEDATHTKGLIPTVPSDTRILPIKHPQFVTRHRHADDYFVSSYLMPSPSAKTIFEALMRRLHRKLSPDPSLQVGHS